jgi:hypothetical protein
VQVGTELSKKRIVRLRHHKIDICKWKIQTLSCSFSECNTTNLIAESVAKAKRTVSPKNITAFSRTQILCMMYDSKIRL